MKIAEVSSCITLPILVQEDTYPDENSISPSVQCALVFTFCMACFRGHLKRISVPCVAGNSESSTIIFKAGSTLVQSAEIFEIFVTNFNQSKARKQCFLASHWSKLGTIPRKYPALLFPGSLFCPFQLP